jgi:hypothetical protein
MSSKFKCNDCEHIFEGDVYTLNCPSCNSANIEQLEEKKFAVIVKEFYNEKKIPIIVVGVILIVLLVFKLINSNDEYKNVLCFIEHDNYIEIKAYTINYKNFTIVDKDLNNNFKAFDKNKKELNVIDGKIYPCKNSGKIDISWTETGYYQGINFKLDEYSKSDDKKKMIEKLSEWNIEDDGKYKHFIYISFDTENSNAECYSYSFEIEQLDGGILEIINPIGIKNSKDTTKIEFDQIQISYKGPKGKLNTYPKGKIQLKNREKYDVFGIIYGYEISEPKGGKDEIIFGKIKIDTLKQKANELAANPNAYALQDSFFNYLKLDKEIVIILKYKGTKVSQQQLVDSIEKQNKVSVSVVKSNNGYIVNFK